MLIRGYGTLKEVYNDKDNCFTEMRIILATMVIFSHSYRLLSGNYNGEPLVRLTNNQLTFAAVAVNSFFILSGFLITQSFLNSQSLKTYCMKRLLRIIPAFYVSLLFVTLILGPLMTNMSLQNYFFQKGENNPFNFIIKNATFNIWGYSWTVQDFTSKNPFPNSANGSMWTLKHEIALYLSVPLLGFFLFLRHRILALMLTVIIGVLAYLSIRSGFMLFLLPGDKFWVIGTYEYNTFIKLAYYFLSGSLMYLYRDRLYFSVRFILLALIVLLIGNRVGHFNEALLVGLPYLIIAIGAGLKLPLKNNIGDFSYGMYIYAFPVQQTIVYLFKNNLTPVSFFLSSFIVTLFLAVLSWKYIEKPALSLKNVFEIKNLMSLENQVF